MNLKFYYDVPMLYYGNVRPTEDEASKAKENSMKSLKEYESFIQ